MKKLTVLTICLLTFLSFTLTAAASPSYWTHPDYDLSKVNAINVTEFIENSKSAGNFTAEKNAQQNVMSALYAAASKQNFLITENPAVEAEKQTTTQSPLLKKTKKAPKAVDLQVTVNRLGYSSRIVPAHFENKIEYVSSTVVDSNGHYKEVSIPIPHKVYVQEVTYYTAYLEIIYNVYDPETGTMIFTSRDSRDRGDTYSTNGMLERSTKDLLKNIKKGK